jgi:hypothetical protein
LHQLLNPLFWVAAAIAGMFWDAVKRASRVAARAARFLASRIGANREAAVHYLPPVGASGTSTARATTLGSDAIADSGTVYVRLTPSAA